jgi:SAM-dependent MidA family methyltransferase
MQKISDFINKSLFDKNFGYYKTKNPIGKNADFITSPEISQIFGELIALYLIEIIAEKNSNFSLLEMGAGKGTWMFDILTTIQSLAKKNNEKAKSFLSKTSFNIVEINPVLTNLQQQKLANFNINWFENFDDFIRSKKIDSQIIFISNELFDCFAIDQFILTEVGWRERIIENTKFTLAEFNQKTHADIEDKINKSNLSIPNNIQNSSKNLSLLPLGAVFEYSQTAENFMNLLCKNIAKYGFLAINIDYGYFENKFYSTLQAVKNNQKVDILKEAPNCDITALVNFKSLDNIAKKYCLNSSLITQKEFLTSLGIEERRKKLLEKNPDKTIELNSAIDRLIDKNQMGELFKTHIIWK